MIHLFAALAALSAQPAATAAEPRLALRDVGAATAPGKPATRRCLWTATRPDGTRLEGSRPASCAEARRAIVAEVARLSR